MKTAATAFVSVVLFALAATASAGVNPGAPGGQLSQSGAKVAVKKEAQDTKADPAKEEATQDKKSH